MVKKWLTGLTGTLVPGWLKGLQGFHRKAPGVARGSGRLVGEVEGLGGAGIVAHRSAEALSLLRAETSVSLRTKWGKK